MGLKVLLLNFPYRVMPKASSNITLFQGTIKQKPTLHDFHAILMDVNSVFNQDYWGLAAGEYLNASNYSLDELKSFGAKTKEQIATGGITFLFGGPSHDKTYLRVSEGYYYVNNYFCCPIYLGVVNDKGDTFYPKFEELKYFNPLIKQIPKGQTTWQCYFSALPEKTRILGVNRAGYAIFAEIPIDNGKLVMLPCFEDIGQAATILIYDVLPQMIHEEEFSFMPQWLSVFSSPFEEQTKETLRQIDKTKRLLYTKDKTLKNAVAFAFETLGFNVNMLPDGTIPDLEISCGSQRAICEVKGHENRQSNRKDILQLLGYSDEKGKEEKGIFISNHEFCKEPQQRAKVAYTEGAVQLGEKTGLSLISAVELYEVTMMILRKELSVTAAKDAREKILTGSGIVHLV